MTTDRIQRAISDDGTEIAGRVTGQGPPVVLVHGAMADGESEWAELLPSLTDRFTCYLPSTRGRGLSSAHPDLSREARVRDVTHFVDSIGGPVGLVGVSGGGMLALGAAARSSAVTAVAVREPVVFETMSESLRARLSDTVRHMSEAAEHGRAPEAVGAFFELIANDEELAALSGDEEGLELAVQYLAVDLAELRDALELEGPSPTDPAVLRQIAAPVLLLHGAKTALPWFTVSTRYVADRVPDATLHEIPGAGHLGHLVNPEPEARELIPFLTAADRAA